MDKEKTTETGDRSEKTIEKTEVHDEETMSIGEKIYRYCCEQLDNFG